MLSLKKLKPREKIILCFLGKIVSNYKNKEILIYNKAFDKSNELANFKSKKIYYIYFKFC